MINSKNVIFRLKPDPVDSCAFIKEAAQAIMGSLRLRRVADQALVILCSGRSLNLFSG
jgi:hypothetical protein